MLGGKHHGTLSDSEMLNATKSLPGKSKPFKSLDELLADYHLICGFSLYCR